MIISKINFPIYGIILVLSMIIGMLYIYLSLKKEKFNNKNIFLYFFMMIIFIIYFGKLFTMLTEPNQNNIITAGLSSYGGLIGLVLSAIIFEKILPSNNKIIKYSILSLPLIYGLSKIACFIVGCCYGIPYNGPFSVTYTNGLNIPLFPIQIVETISFLILFIICNKLKNNKNIIYLTILICSTAKFLLDYLRYDHITKFMTVNQMFSIVLIFVTIMMFVYNRKKVFNK